MFFGKNLKYLRKQKGLNQDEMQAGTGIARGTWSDYERENTEPPFKLLIKISEFFGVTIDALLKDDIEIQKAIVHLNQNKGVQKNPEIVHPIVHPNVHLKAQNDPFQLTFAAEPQADYEGHLVPVPITDISVAAGSGYFNQDYVSNVDAIRLPVTLLKRGNTYLCVKIKGPSMAPTLQDGGYVIIRLLDKGEWAKMPDERVFVVADVDGKAYLKRVKNRFKQGFIVLRSDNPDQANFGSFNLTTEEINTIWAVEWYFTAKMPNIHDQYYTRLQRIEDRLEDLINGNLKINPKLK